MKIREQKKPEERSRIELNSVLKAWSQERERERDEEIQQATVPINFICTITRAEFSGAVLVSVFWYLLINAVLVLRLNFVLWHGSTLNLHSSPSVASRSSTAAVFSTCLISSHKLRFSGYKLSFALETISEIAINSMFRYTIITMPMKRKTKQKQNIWDLHWTVKIFVCCCQRKWRFHFRKFEWQPVQPSTHKLYY